MDAVAFSISHFLLNNTFVVGGESCPDIQTKPYIYKGLSTARIERARGERWETWMKQTNCPAGTTSGGLRALLISTLNLDYAHTHTHDVMAGVHSLPMPKRCE